MLDPELFQRVRAVYEARERSGLDAQQQRVVTRRYESFVRRGANLSPEQKQQLSAYNQELARLFAEFSEKVLADEETFHRGERGRAGRRARGRPQCRGGGGAGAQPARRPVRHRQHALGGRSGADLRRQSGLARTVWRAFVNRGDNGDANDTNGTIARRSSRRAPTAPGCSASRATPIGGCRTRWRARPSAPRR